MSVHADRRQQLIGQADQAEKAVHDIDDGWPDDATRDRAGQVLAYSRTVVEGSDAALISANMASTLTNAYGDFFNNAESTIVASSDAYADAVLDAVAALPHARDQEFAEGVKESITKVKQSAAMHMRNLDDERAALVGKLATLDGEITTMRDELTTMAEQSRQQVESEIATARAPFETEIEQARQQLTAEQTAMRDLRTEQSAEFEEAEKKRVASAKAQREQVETDAEEQRETIKTSLDEFLGTSKGEVDERVADIERMQEDVRKMVDATSLMATTEGYGKEAKEQKDAANVWRWITVASALLAAGLAFLAVNVEEIDLEVLIGKLVLSLILGGIAAYAAKQSGYHRTREQIARDLQLELAIFGPFIERLDPEQQQEERVQMARKTFGHVRPVSQNVAETPTAQAADPAAAEGVGQSPGFLSLAAQQLMAAVRGGGQQQP